MHFGEKLKQLRKQKNWTQPHLAEAIGIEQSYLSKLENGKSVPSADIYQLILKSFELSTAELLEDVDSAIIHRQLRQIPEVSNYLITLQSSQYRSQKYWLFVSLAFLFIGLSSLIAGYWGLVFQNNQYSYQSSGVVLPGESKEVYSNYDANFLYIKNAEKNAIRKAMSSRLDEKYLNFDEYQGELFNLPVENGSRTYRLKRIRAIQHPVNRYLMLFGVIAFSIGLAGLIVDRKLG